MTFEGDPLAYQGRNIIEEYHETLKQEIPFDIPDVPALPPSVIRLPIPEHKVGILGAGIGGLYTALILDSLDIDYEVLEASDRVGGRLFTYRFPDSGKYDYYDVGAMRYPLPKKDDQGRYKNGIMKRLGELIEYPPLNQGQVPLKSTLIPYYYTTREGAGFLYYNRVRARTNDVKPDFDAVGMGVVPKYAKAGAKAISDDVIKPFVKIMVEDMEQGGKEGWEVMKANDKYSVRGYMSSKYIPSVSLDLPPAHLPMNVVNWCGLLGGSSGGYDRALTESVFSSLAFAEGGSTDWGDVEWKCFDGGSEVLTKYMEDYINGPDREKGIIHFNKRITGMMADPFIGLVDTILIAKGVGREAMERMITCGVTVEDAKYVVSTGVTREDVEQLLRGAAADKVNRRLAENTTPGEVERRIAGLTSDSSCVGDVISEEERLWLDCLERLFACLRVACHLHLTSSLSPHGRLDRRRFERDAEDGPPPTSVRAFYQNWRAFPGALVDDQAWYCWWTYGVDSQTPSNVLIASYCWTTDADRMGSLINTGSDARLKELVLRNLAEVHGSGITYEFLETQFVRMHAWDWNHEPLFMGAFAFFGPGDFQDLFTSLNAPAADGLLHFAGETLSTRHAWVVGALDSAWRAVHEYLILSGQEGKLPKFKELWGENLEWTRSPPKPGKRKDKKDKNGEEWSDLLRGHLGYIDVAMSAGVLKM